ncbi:MAG: hypothetical protein CMO80_03805 [Verrucomicrobiales bacterium]|nr:hypothetical protein [Verrucomicrobiales bacterium]
MGGESEIPRDSSHMNNYARIARVIEHLDQHGADQPSLSELAAFTGLSASRLHHLFVEWAGVTPKDFLQCLTIERAKEMLRNGQDVLNSSINAGLSGPGRLHDLSVSLQAATPGEIKNGGDGLFMRYAFADSPFGNCLVAETDRGICHVAFVEPGGKTESKNELLASWPNAKVVKNGEVKQTVHQIFHSPGKRTTGLRAWVRGTEFQVKVWRALINIPPAKLTSYNRLAAAINSPRASRAVGNAVGANPLAYLIPCHRVIRETGVIGHYRWRRGRKRALLAWEAVNDSTA